MQFEVLYRELAYSTEMIRALLNGVSQEDARIKPNEGSWSILEVTCHLHDEEREDFREHLDFILYRQKEDWHRIDTQGWVIERRYNEQNLDEMKDKFFAERTKSMEWLKTLATTDWNTTYTTEYRSLSAGDMFSSWVAHDNLHIRQYVELRRLLIVRIAHPYTIDYAGEW